MPKSLVIVESPAKAQTIGRFLGKGYDVKASFGHVRDLPESASDVPEEFKKKKWGKLGVNVEENFEPVYVVTSDKKKHVAELRKAAKDADEILLATDEDREGESISWHILELLRPPKKKEVKRIVFHEITPEAIEEALSNPRQVHEGLVKAQETRRVLDRLYGFTLSPLLWKKVAPKLSAGRVQSVAVRLVVERERERRDFVEAEYWNLLAKLKAKDGEFEAKLLRIDDANVAEGRHFDSEGKLTDDKIVHLKQEIAEAHVEALKQTDSWRVASLETKPGYENPAPPFMTSTLQQEANRKLNYGARRTMSIAQQLYEGIDIGGERVGLITYMRTDSLTLANRAIQEARKFIGQQYGDRYVPEKPRTFKSKSKNAQEAHEAIRPTDISRTPEKMARYLSDEQRKVYDLIWKRTVACQMERARVERTRVEVEAEAKGQTFTFSASGKAIKFPGFLKVYVEGSDDPNAVLGNQETILPKMQENETLDLRNLEATEHSTRPPARYTEASLVGKLESEGIGRPSTYASIISTIQNRDYVVQVNKYLVPTFKAFAVTSLLEDHFNELVDLDFTARMEEVLDEIARGEADYVSELREFYHGENGTPGLAKKVESAEEKIPFPDLLLGEDPESGETIKVRIGKNGPFIQRGEGGEGNTASVPEELAPAELTLAKAMELIKEREAGPEAVAVDPSTGQCVFRKVGRYGTYLELAQTEEEKEKGTKPHRISPPRGESVKDLSEEDIYLLLKFPRKVGKHPETGEELVIKIGPYGPYVEHPTEDGGRPKRASLDDWRKAASISLEEAVKALEEGTKTRGGKSGSKAEAIKEFGELANVGEVKLLSGRYGPYVTNGKVNATVPKGKDPEEVTPEEAVEMIKAKAASKGSGRRKPTRRKKS
jgi:DNA topoisomerase-1